VRPEWRREDPDFTPEREATVLDLVAPIGVATPTLIALDAAGNACGVPAVLTNRLPGTPPRVLGAGWFAQQLAGALASLREVDQREAERRLPAFRRYYDPGELVVPAWSRRPDLWARAIEAAVAEPPAGPTGFIHRDFHPGNTLWEGNRLSAVVDWTTGSWGPLWADAAHMRWNLAIAHGLDVAGEFARRARGLIDASAEHRRYWDLVAVADVVPELSPGALPPGRRLARLEAYLEGVLEG
jgi:aminoglycoside phosphotransferase (APT) family kinase protein